MMDTVKKSDAEWRKELTEEQYAVLRDCGTEPAFTGKYYKTKDKGMYVCAACGAELFSSDTKYDSGSGWPSFTAPVAEGNVEYKEDASAGMVRTEIRCARCGGHLGHVFDDGPADKGGKRFCVNSASLDLKKKE